jgi:hypothetical protein
MVIVLLFLILLKVLFFLNEYLLILILIEIIATAENPNPKPKQETLNWIKRCLELSMKSPKLRPTVSKVVKQLANYFLTVNLLFYDIIYYLIRH